jgi:hypothetical protein
MEVGMAKDKKSPNFSRGTCCICGQEGISSKHYNVSHGIIIGNYFQTHSNYIPPALPPYICGICKVRVSGCHEAVKHLAEMHPEVLQLNQNVETQDVQEVVEIKDEEPELAEALANATIGGVFDFLIGKRREAEVETEFLKMSLEAEKALRIAGDEGLARAMSRITQLGGENQEFKRENARLTEDNRNMNREMLAMRNGARVTQERADTYIEYTKK